MQKYKIALFILYALCCFGIQAQVKQVTIIDDLQAPVAGEGIIKVYSDPKITELIGILSPETSVNEENYVKTDGFRIQVFMSNNSKIARGEIANKEGLIKTTFPDLAIYTGYEAPNWKLLVGDFMTKEEASVFRQQMLKAIPELGKEMYIIPSKVNISLQKNN